MSADPGNEPDDVYDVTDSSSSDEEAEEIFYETHYPESDPPAKAPSPRVEVEHDDTIPESTWQKWVAGLEPSDLDISEKIVEDDAKEVRLQLLSPLGKGVSGCVYAVKILKGAFLEGTVVALKVFRTNAAAVSQGTNEVLILQYLNRIVSKTPKIPVLRIYKNMHIRGHIAFLMELGGPNLFQIIGVRGYTGLNLPSIRTIVTRLLEVLGVLESRGIVHADIKPENILISMRKCFPIHSLSEYTANLTEIIEKFRSDETTDVDVVLVDWSSASIGYSQQAPYIQSRFYRAPEVILRGKYGPSVDMWSLGCVATELFLAAPLFPGGDEIDMLKQIQLKLGILPASVSRKIGDESPAKHSDEWKLDQSMYSPGNFELFLRERSGRDDFDFLAFINILRLMLQLNCDARITAASGLLHPFITGSVQKQPMRALVRRDSMMEDSTSMSGAKGRRTRRYSQKRKSCVDIDTLKPK